MSNPNPSEIQPVPPNSERHPGPEPEKEPEEESFSSLLSQYERSHARSGAAGERQVEATVAAIRGDQILLDIGLKIEGVMPLAALGGETVNIGDRFPVSIRGRNEEGYYEVSRRKIARPIDWAGLEAAFAGNATITGTVTGVVKGGLTVDIGVRAFLPASRSGARDAAEMEKLIGQEIQCRILKLEQIEEDVVVDRRAIQEEEERAVRQRRFAELKEGDTVRGTIRSLADYGAFVDIGGVDGLLHVGDISWARVNNPADVLSPGQQIEAKVLKIDAEKRRIGLGLKQLQPHPWDAVPEKFKVGDRVQGTVTRLSDFGAFLELEPGIEGLIHVSEMSWVKKVRKPSDLLKQGDRVESVILSINTGERRMSLGLKQTLDDPWATAPQKFPVGSVIEGPITSFTKFGAFVSVAEGIEGMVHISEITQEKRINHPQDVLRLGQQVKAQVLEVDPAKRQLRLSMKRLIPVSVDEYMAERKLGDAVTGRIVEINGSMARVELGEGIEGACRLPAPAENRESSQEAAKLDLSSLSSMLQARWKGASSSGSSNATAGRTAQAEPARAGQIRNFRITGLDPRAKKIELELA